MYAQQIPQYLLTAQLQVLPSLNQQCIIKLLIHVYLTQVHLCRNSSLTSGRRTPSTTSTQQPNLAICFNISPFTQ